jgi:hypothetical protein
MKITVFLLLRSVVWIKVTDVSDVLTTSIVRTIGLFLPEELHDAASQNTVIITFSSLHFSLGKALPMQIITCKLTV